MLEPCDQRIESIDDIIRRQRKLAPFGRNGKKKYTEKIRQSPKTSGEYDQNVTKYAFGSKPQYWRYNHNATKTCTLRQRIPRDEDQQSRKTVGIHRNMWAWAPRWPINPTLSIRPRLKNNLNYFGCAICSFFVIATRNAFGQTSWRNVGFSQILLVVPSIFWNRLAKKCTRLR